MRKEIKNIEILIGFFKDLIIEVVKMGEKEIKKEKEKILEKLEFGKYLTDSLKELDEHFYEEKISESERIYKEGGYHWCGIFDFDVGDHKRALYGEAVVKCYESDDDNLYVSNGEYGNRVNYCPFCGYKTKILMKLKKE